MSTLTDVNSPEESNSQIAANPASPATANTVLTVEEIQELLPHRYPFALVDRIIE